jgi:hypothetical protein
MFNIEEVVFECQPVLTMSVANELKTIQAHWPLFEKKLLTLKGRKLMGLQSSPLGEGFYTYAATLRHPGETIEGLEKSMSPEGRYYRIRLKGEDRMEQIGDAFNHLIQNAKAIDWTRPSIEFYRSDTIVDIYLARQ